MFNLNDKNKKNLQVSSKEPPVLIMDMHVHISERWFLIDALHKTYERATLPKDFKG